MTFSSKKKLFFFSALFTLAKPMKFSDSQILFLENYFKKMNVSCDVRDLISAKEEVKKCSGKTKKGTECKKKAVEGKMMCSYHVKDEPVAIQSELSEEYIVDSSYESDGGHSSHSLELKKSKELDELFGDEETDIEEQEY